MLVFPGFGFGFSNFYLLALFPKEKLQNQEKDVAFFNISVAYFCVYLRQRPLFYIERNNAVKAERQHDISAVVRTSENLTFCSETGTKSFVVYRNSSIVLGK